MAISRRGFLGLLAASGLSSLASASGLPIDAPKITPKMTSREKLFLSYLPVLEANEQKVLNFYRCSQSRVTVGYGTNLSAHQKKFQDLNITILYQGRPLTQKQRDIFFNNAEDLHETTLKKYTISETDALRLAQTTTNEFIDFLDNHFRKPTDKSKRAILFDGLPLCMQALALDVLYNTGTAGFKKYVKFDNALRIGDYETAVAESRVFTNKKTREYNIQREIRKKRFLDICKIVWRSVNKGERLSDLLPQIVASYDAQPDTSKKTKERHLNLCAETALATGEYYHFKQNWRQLSASQFKQEIANNMQMMDQVLKRQNLASLTKQNSYSMG